MQVQRDIEPRGEVAPRASISTVGGQVYVQCMRKINVVVVSVIASALLTLNPVAANAADLKNAVKTIVSGFQETLNLTLDQIDALSQEHAKNIADINQVFLDSTAKVNATQASDLLALSNLYNPKIAASNAALGAAKLKWDSVNLILIKDSFGWMGNVQTVAGNNFVCPPSTLPNGPTWLEIVKRTCNGSPNPMLGARSTKGNPGSTIGGEDWQKGDIGKLNKFEVSKELQSVLDDGYMAPVNQVEFDSTRLTIKSETANIDSLNVMYSKARVDLTAKYDASVALIKSSTDKALADEDIRFQALVDDLQAKADQTQSFVLASERAAANYKTFDKAFTTALQFEYNQAQLGEIANLPWAVFTTNRNLSSIMKVVALSDLANSIADNYTYAKAVKLNAAVSTTFTKAPVFSSSLKTAKTYYAKLIKK